MTEPHLQAYYQTLQKACLPGIWSKGVTIARDNLVQIDSYAPDEIILRVKATERAISAKVSLWPRDEDYFCDCEDRADPCAHVAGAVAALKNGLKPTDSTEGSGPAIRYRFFRNGKALLFERVVGKTPLHESLVSLVGGVNSGRINRPTIAATQDDFAIDRALGEFANSPDGRLDRATILKLFPALRSVSGLELDAVPIQIGAPTKGLHAELRDEGSGFRLIGLQDPSITEIFDNGVLLYTNVLRVLEDPQLSPLERKILSPPGKWFSPAEVPRLMSEIIPALEKKIPVKTLTRKLPMVSEEDMQAPPQVILNFEKTAEHTLSVYSSVQYPSEYSVRDPVLEKALAKQLQSDLHLIAGHRVEFRGMAAINFNLRARAYQDEHPEFKIVGASADAFALEASITPDFQPDLKTGFQLSFTSASGKSIDPAQVLDAWRNHQTHIPLLGGGYAPLPIDWLEKFGSRIMRLIDFRERNQNKIPNYLRPELVEITQELGGEVPDSLLSFKSMLETFDKIPEAELPKGLRAELRHYQRQGVNWLCFLRHHGIGALLADDMGLGKTLQALCAVRGRTLIVTPTSVLHSWRDQIQKFRPDLKVSLFYGSPRKLDPSADITLTSYGLLRGDRETLFAQEWDTAVLDEAQIIKNPESQVAQAAHQIQAAFRITLSGTPVENRMDDLWSQFQFLNPGILGSKKDFQEEFAAPIGRGDVVTTQRLRTRIKPFILRRMKKEVAPELPEKTEVVLECELSPAEREVYDALLATARKDVLEKLEEGGSVMHALELLLRLRQACCHSALVPGQQADTSSKIELLAQTLENSIAMGHRALVFSQWTSFLDLIEPRLKQMGVKYLRLDGTTTNRQDVVKEFQDPKGPPVMLISLRAGGVGLNLTAADHVFLMDSWWNPAVEDQAADRAHRIGQENPVFVFRMIAQNTLEERIFALQKRKLELSGAVLEGSAQSISLTRDDIMALLSED